VPKEHTIPDSAVGPKARHELWIFISLLVLAYLPVLWDLARDWWNEAEHSHGFLVFAFSSALIWRRRESLTSPVQASLWWGISLLVLAGAMRVFGQLAMEFYTLRVSFVVALCGAFFLQGGGSWFRTVRFPLLFSLFMIPLPAMLFHAVAFPLQRISAVWAARTLDLLGIPVLLEGNILHLAHGSFGVTEACSGIRSLIALLTLATAWGVLTLSGSTARVSMALMALPATVLANTSRVVLTGIVGLSAGMHYTQGLYHTVGGLLVFGLAVGILAACHACIRRLTGPSPNEEPS